MFQTSCLGILLGLVLTWQGGFLRKLCMVREKKNLPDSLAPFTNNGERGTDPGRPPNSQSRRRSQAQGRLRREGSRCSWVLIAQVSSQQLQDTEDTTVELPARHPAHPVYWRVSGPYGFGISRGWQGTEGMRAHKAPFPTSQRLQSRMSGQHPQTPSWMWDAVSQHP